MKCPKCNAELENDTKFCSNCGAAVITADRNGAGETTVLSSEPAPQKKAVDPNATMVLSSEPAPQKKAVDPNATTVLSSEPAQSITCKACGATNEVSSMFCLSCGKPLKANAPVKAASPQTQQPQSKIVTDNNGIRFAAPATQPVIQQPIVQPVIKTPAVMYCPACHKPYTPGEKFCAHCGQNLTVPYVPTCPNCGKEYKTGEQFCNNCGAPLKSNGASDFIQNIKNKWNAIPQQKRKNIIIIAASVAVALIILIVLLCNVHKCDYCDQWFFGKAYNINGNTADKDCYSDYSYWAWW